jgi:uncharacterized cupredoxin-like copper-binding protein
MLTTARSATIGAVTRGLSGLLAIAAAGFALAGCGGSSHSSSTNVPGTTVSNVRVAKTFVIHETEYRLRPRKILIPRFGYYAFKGVNDGTVAHALEITGPGVQAKTGNIEPGDSAQFAVLFKRTGTYKLFCPVDGHRAKGMQATVRVP